MKRILIAGLAGLSLTQIAAADPVAGYDRFAVDAPHRAGLIAASVWYPVGSPTYPGTIGENAIFHGVEAYVGAGLPEGRMPLVLLSHGSGGNMDGLAWLSSGLAARGAMVLAVNHPGSTTGDSSPRRSVRLADRAADLSAALDHLLADPDFAGRIDPERITALGFSLGGSTALGMGGLELDAGAYEAYCAGRGADQPDCMFLARGGVDTGALPPAFSAGMREARVTSVVAVDPGFTHAAREESAAAMDLPVMVLSLGEPVAWTAVDVTEAGSGLMGLLPRGSHVAVPRAHHFSFLPLCKPGAAALLIEEGEDPICDDPEGWDRDTVHAASIEAIARFLGL